MAKKPELDPALAAILAQNNVELDKEEEYKETPEQTHFRGEGVLYALEYPLSPRVTKVCKQCKNPFLANYNGTAHCSQECLVRNLREHFGIAWVPNQKSKLERWQIKAPPAVIPLAALQAMKVIVAQAEADLGYPLPIPDVKPFVVQYPYFGKVSVASESDYKLPASVALPGSVSTQPLEPHSSQSLPHESLSDKTEKEAQSQEQNQSKPDDDPFGEIFADL